MTLNVPKGVDVAVVILIVINSISNIGGISLLQNIILLFILYSIVLSTVSSVFNEWYFSRS